MGFATHDVTNQPPALEGYDVFGADRVLSEAVDREGAGWAAEALGDLGRRAGSAECIEWGFTANANPPVLRTHDRFGHRVDEVAYHPHYHRLMKTATTFGLHGAPWADTTAGSHVARAAGLVVWSQVDAGHTCPISMTYSVVPALRRQPELAAAWEHRLTDRGYGPDLDPTGKDSALAGMGMTEKQGGSDVRANTTTAAPTGSGGAGDEYRLTGHKWFCSAPMSDLFLMLAQAPGGLSCFAVPRVLSDGSRNRFRIQRLKDKLGDRSNASSEVELADTAGWLVGEEGRGVPTIIEMVNHTRLDCVLGSTAVLRLGTAQALHHTAHRSAFGRRLADQPLMQAVLADLAVESEAATVTALRLARAYDVVARAGSGLVVDGEDVEHERLIQRLATPVIKYWVCKRAPGHAAEALECHGGNGFVEESVLPRLFRQSPLNGIWEGSGNVICLDVLRVMGRKPEATAAFFDELGRAAGADRRLDDFVARLTKELADLDRIESRARRIVEDMALAFQGSLLVRFGDSAVADAFCATRLDGDWGRALGTLPSGIDVAAIIARHAPTTVAA